MFWEHSGETEDLDGIHTNKDTFARAIFSVLDCLPEGQGLVINCFKATTKSNKNYFQYLVPSVKMMFTAS